MCNNLGICTGCWLLELCLEAQESASESSADADRMAEKSSDQAFAESEE